MEGLEGYGDYLLPLLYPCLIRTALQIDDVSTAPHTIKYRYILHLNQNCVYRARGLLFSLLAMS